MPSNTGKGAQGVSSQPAASTAVQWHVFRISSPHPYPIDITEGPDGALWFTEYPSGIGRITVNGHITEYKIPTTYSLPSKIIRGPDNNLWFNEQGRPKSGESRRRELSQNFRSRPELWAA
ncbi:MAG: virginiamycin B lyase family protein [Candidatus Eremiobacter antarcticus]